MLSGCGMAGVRDHTELEAWKLSDEIRVQIHRLCRSPGFRAHFELAQQLMGAADSACSNIAEGLSRYYPKEFARFLKISRGSQAEVADRLRSAVLRGLIEQEEADAITRLTHRARAACTRLIHYLDGATAPGS
jgi:four helix bundle protein